MAIYPLWNEAKGDLQWYARQKGECSAKIGEMMTAKRETSGEVVFLHTK